MAYLKDALTARWLQDSYLVGVNLTLDDGSQYPPALYESSIRAAVQWAEDEIGIAIDARTVTGEMHDAFTPNRTGWWPFALDARPVRSITSFAIQYGSYEPVAIPLQWLTLVNPNQGKFHLIPSQQALGSYVFHQGIPLILGDVMQPNEYIPAYFRCTYDAGFSVEAGQVTMAEGVSTAVVTLPATEVDTRYYAHAEFVGTPPKDAASTAIEKPSITLTATGKSTTQFTVTASAPMPAGGGTQTIAWSSDRVPDSIRHVIGLRAALTPLDVAGDLIAGAGIANKSIGIDGLSQSIGTTSSATNAGYGARVLQFERELKAMLPAIRAAWKGPELAII